MAFRLALVLALALVSVIVFRPLATDAEEPVPAPSPLDVGPGLPAVGGAFADRPEALALWEGFKARFVTPEGRVIDDANGNVSHSEGQGYAMLLAVAADDPETFARVWAWTRSTLMIRPDGLAAWRWRPDATPAIADTNNASDGDLLIAWALAEAGSAWGESGYTRDARHIATTLRREMITKGASGALLLPGARGFAAADRPDGPVVNLSYWVFPAFRRLTVLLPDSDWGAVTTSGLALAAKARFGPADLPADWIALGGDAPKPADGFSPVFSYDAIRVPLYLAWSGLGTRDLLAPFHALWQAGAAARPAVIDVASGRALTPMPDKGYQAIAAITACALEGTRFPDSLRTPDVELYYPTTLRLLAFLAIDQRYPQCW